jgi:hypothetical protein
MCVLTEGAQEGAAHKKQRTGVCERLALLPQAPCCCCCTGAPGSGAGRNTETHTHTCFLLSTKGVKWGYVSGTLYCWSASVAATLPAGMEWMSRRSGLRGVWPPLTCGVFVVVVWAASARDGGLCQNKRHAVLTPWAQSDRSTQAEGARKSRGGCQGLQPGGKPAQTRQHATDSTRTPGTAPLPLSGAPAVCACPPPFTADVPVCMCV